MYRRKKEPEEYGYMDRDEDDFLEEDQDEMESGMIDRQKGRRLIAGCSTVSSYPPVRLVITGKRQ